MSAMLSATRNTNAWIVAGGSDKGIMKLVGDALATSHQATTAIGIAPWGTIEGRTELTDDSEAQRELEESLYDCTVRPTPAGCLTTGLSEPWSHEPWQPGCAVVARGMLSCVGAGVGACGDAGRQHLLRR